MQQQVQVQIQKRVRVLENRLDKVHGSLEPLGVQYAGKHRVLQLVTVPWGESLSSLSDLLNIMNTLCIQEFNMEKLAPVFNFNIFRLLPRRIPSLNNHFYNP